MKTVLKSMGQKIRETRVSQGLTLKDIAGMTGLTESLLSQIENSKANPSVTTLLAVSKALNTPVGEFFETATSQQSPIIRRNERPIARTGDGITYYLLTPNNQGLPMEVIFNEFKANADTGEFITHEGHECGVVLQGKLEVRIEEEIYILNEGDSITIDSSRPHKIRNIGDHTARAIWIDSPPSF